MQIKTTKHKFCLTAIFTVLIAASCMDRNTVRQQNITVKDCIWNKDTALKFNIPVEDTLTWYSLSVVLRNRTDYGFQNLYLFLDISAPNGHSITDTLNFILAYDDGKWKGSGGLFSKFRENTFLYREYIRFPEHGIYTVNVRHGMRKDNLEGISSVGLALNYSEN